MIEVYSDMITAYETWTPLTATFSSNDPELPTLFPEEMCVDLHLDDMGDIPRREYLNVERIRQALGQIAHHINIRRDVVEYRNVIGVTHEGVANMAVKHFGFKPVPDIPLNSFYPNTIDELRDYFNSDPHLIYMPSRQFVHSFLTGEPSPEIIVKASSINLQDRIDSYSS